jgi:hypothetical protein
MDFDVYYDIDCETYHGEGGSLQFTNVISELIQGASAFDVIKVVIKIVIQGVNA